MTEIFAKIVLDSISPDGIRLTTLHLRYPRFIHPEFLTHRLFSRNARSSRAVPFKVFKAELLAGCAMPLHWGAAQKGMQADNETDAPVIFEHMDEQGVWWKEEFPFTSATAWLWARDRALEVAEGFYEAGYHEQVYNRLLEPFMHIDVLVSATDWSNFMAPRDHKDAEPHIAILAREIKKAMDASEPQLLYPDQWHLPYITPEDHLVVEDWLANEKKFGVARFGPAKVELLKEISAARCARISYAPFDGDGSIEKELERFRLLIESAPMHASPVEHQATPDTQSYQRVQRAITPKSGSITNGDVQWETIKEGLDWDNPNLHGNFRGFNQFRKTLPGEAVW